MLIYNLSPVEPGQGKPAGPLKPKAVPTSVENANTGYAAPGCPFKARGLKFSLKTLQCLGNQLNGLFVQLLMSRVHYLAF